MSGRLLDRPARLLLAAAPPDAIPAVEHGACGSVLQMLPNGATAAFMLPMPPPPTDVVGEVAPPPAPT